MLTITRGGTQEEERELIPNIDVEMAPGGIRLAPVIRQLIDNGFNIRDC
jgi:hypothetical protein